jgi:hypothetical protein
MSVELKLPQVVYSEKITPCIFVDSRSNDDVCDDVCDDSDDENSKILINQNIEIIKQLKAITIDNKNIISDLKTQTKNIKKIENQISKIDTLTINVNKLIELVEYMNS